MTGDKLKSSHDGETNVIGKAQDVHLEVFQNGRKINNEAVLKKCRSCPEDF